MKLGINGMGRIGRLALRAAMGAAERPADDPRRGNRLEVPHLKELRGGAAATAHLLEFDSVQGRWRAGIGALGEDTLRIGEQCLSFSSHATPAEIPWGDLGVDLVLECTGKFLTPQTLQKGNCVIYVDIDRLHVLNENLGMHVGDSVIVRVAEPCKPPRSVARAVTVCVPTVNAVVVKVAPVPIWPIRLEVHTRLAVNTPSCTSFAVPAKVIAEPVVIVWLATGAVIVTVGAVLPPGAVPIAAARSITPPVATVVASDATARRVVRMRSRTCV